MEEIIEKLITKGYFLKVNINEKGYGSFIRTKSNYFLEKARILKKQADVVIKTDKKNAVKCYLDAMILYIKAYTEDEANKTLKQTIHNFEMLFTYINDVCKIMDSNNKYREFTGIALFAVKMHLCKLNSHLYVHDDLKVLCKIFENEKAFCTICDLPGLWEKTKTE